MRERIQKIDPEIQKFTEAYKAKVGKPVDQSNAPNSYQSFLAIAAAIDSDKVTDAQSAADAIAAQTDFEVPGGTLVRWEKGHAIWNTSIVGFDDNGNFKLIKTVPSE